VFGETAALTWVRGRCGATARLSEDQLYRETILRDYPRLRYAFQKILPRAYGDSGCASCWISIFSDPAIQGSGTVGIYFSANSQRKGVT
jgi:hypothetical protein